MEIVLPVYGTLDFNRPKSYEPRTRVHSESKTAWSAVKTVNGIEIDFNFDYYNPNSEKPIEEVNWGNIRRSLLNIDGRIDGMMQKSIPAITALHDSIFKKKFEHLEAYFLLEEIELLVLNSKTMVNTSQPPHIGAVHKLGFYLESLVDDMAQLDPYCTYNAYFQENGSICGVSRA